MYVRTQTEVSKWFTTKCAHTAAVVSSCYSLEHIYFRPKPEVNLRFCKFHVCVRFFPAERDVCKSELVIICCNHLKIQFDTFGMDFWFQKVKAFIMFREKKRGKAPFFCWSMRFFFCIAFPPFNELHIEARNAYIHATCVQAQEKVAFIFHTFKTSRNCVCL